MQSHKLLLKAKAFFESVTPLHLLLMDLLIVVGLWAFQAGQSSTVIENIHTIIAAAAVKFSFDQLSHLFILIQKVSAVSATLLK